MDLQMFDNPLMGHLIDIAGVDPIHGEWSHQAFVATDLTQTTPELSGRAYRAVADARAALAALDSTARQLPNPRLLRQPTLRQEAQSTSALEGTYEPLRAVLTAGDEPDSVNMREILNYVAMAEDAFAWVERQRPITITFLCHLQERLVRGTSSDGPGAGDVRHKQVVIGRREGLPVDTLPVVRSRFVPHPGDDDLRIKLATLIDWIRADHAAEIDPVVAAAMLHYQFETLHPFEDGNGRLGRLLVVLYLFSHGVLSEPTLTVSPWFEARRTAYYEHLLDVSAHGDWNTWIEFFARGVQQSATRTERQMVSLVDAQHHLKETVRASSLRGDAVMLLIDFAVANVSFTVKGAAAGLGFAYQRTNRLVDQLVTLGILEPFDDATYNRRFYAPDVLKVLVQPWEERDV